ncbi:MAG: hypothetical protein M1833_002863 [Piccolia ochrophora]|nr:MAG: hypothetical protein M1833_002863 [Piccolia ochrophora]
MPRQLEPLLLPQLVEARKSQEHKDIDMDTPDLSNSYQTPNSSASEFSLPITPTASQRGHSRFPISSSSISFDSTSHSLNKIIPSPPSSVENVETFQTGMRSLPDVKEEPVEREGDYDMLEDVTHFNCSCYGFQGTTHGVFMRGTSMAMPSSTDYDFGDSFLNDCALALTPRVKKRRGGDSPLSGIATRLGNSLPSFSRRWKSRKINRAAVEQSRDSAPSRTGSSRTSSLTRSMRDSSDGREIQYPPTPAKSAIDEDEEMASPPPIDIEEANWSEEANEGQATTPLLPPLMIPETSAADTFAVVQSPLQSPTVAETPDPMSTAPTPKDASGTPRLASMPSPPASRRPSASSFHKQLASQLVPASEIPGIKLADPDDEWSNRLGHANFDIHPEPYLPDVFDLENCKQFRANWELARCNYTKHLFRTGEHYGATSKTYKLTEEKWGQINARWKQNHDLTIAKTHEGNESTSDIQESAKEPAALTKIPSMNDPSSEGKFPKLGDEEIVGPMEVQAASQSHRKPSRKASFLRFLHSPSSMLGRSLGGSKQKPR